MLSLVDWPVYPRWVRARAQCGADSGKGPAGGASAHSGAANLPEAFPSLPRGLAAKANGRHAIASTPRKIRAPRRQKLDLGRGTRTRRPANGTLSAPSHVGFVSG